LGSFLGENNTFCRTCYFLGIIMTTWFHIGVICKCKDGAEGTKTEQKFQENGFFL